MEMNAVAEDRITRVLFQDFPTWAVVVFYLFALAAMAVFAWGCWLQWRNYARGRPEPLDWQALRGRVGALARSLLTHRPIRRRDSAAGHAHAQVFFGFLLLFAATSIITLDYDILAPLGLGFWHGDFYLLFSLVVDIAGLAFVIGISYLMLRRGWLRPAKLDYSRPDREASAPDAERSAYRREDWAFLWLLWLIGVSGFVLEAARLVWLQADPTVWPYRWWSPVGALLADAMRASGLQAGAAAGLREWLWWGHGLLSLAFIALLPYTKARHAFTALATLLLRDPAPVQRLPPVALDEVSIGYHSLADVSRRHLLQADTCTRCGRCHEACPATATGAPLSPRDLVLSLREMARGWTGPTAPAAAEGAAAAPALRGEGVNQIRDETLWSCLNCAACVEICPVAVEHVPMVAQMRRAAVDRGQMPEAVQAPLKSLHKNGNAFGESRRKRPAWARKLPFRIKDARKEPVEVLWFVGDFASFDPRYQKVSQSFARILHAAGVDFGILYEGESSAGNDVRRLGEEGLYQHLAATNASVLGKARFERIVTTDPHSYNTLRNEYGEFGAEYPVEHASAFLQSLLEQERLELARPLPRRVSFHDPCHLGRYNRGFEPPRQVLRRLGTDLVELPRSRENAFCCGGGGGRVWQPDAPGRQRVSANRIEEAAGVEGLQTLVVSCPKCMTMLEDAAKTGGHQERFEVRELIELVAEAMDLPPLAGAA